MGKNQNTPKLPHLRYEQVIAAAALRDPAGERKALILRVQPPLLDADELVVMDGYDPRPGETSISLHGEDLSRVVSFLAAYPSLAAAVDGDDVNLRLKGLAKLIRGSEGDDSSFDREVAYFVSNALEDLAARLESSPTHKVTVGLLKKSAKTGGA
jgi:hypothetical protein